MLFHAVQLVFKSTVVHFACFQIILIFIFGQHYGDFQHFPFFFAQEADFIPQERCIYVQSKVILIYLILGLKQANRPNMQPNLSNKIIMVFFFL